MRKILGLPKVTRTSYTSNCCRSNRRAAICYYVRIGEPYIRHIIALLGAYMLFGHPEFSQFF